MTTSKIKSQRSDKKNQPPLKSNKTKSTKTSKPKRACPWLNLGMYQPYNN